MAVPGYRSSSELVRFSVRTVWCGLRITAGFMGGRVDQLMMRFADFVVALPFLLFMILFKIAFGIGPGESGVFPMLVALVVLQLARNRPAGRADSANQGTGLHQCLSLLRRYAFDHASPVPNTLGVVLVTVTFAIPSAIFTGIPFLHWYGCSTTDAFLGFRVQ